MSASKYLERSAQRAAHLAKRGNIRILAIESSCDDTAAAISLDGRKILACAQYSQAESHRRFGGVVPEVASRAHVQAVDPLVDSVLKGAGLSFSDIDAIAVTDGPGLVGSLLVGVSAAKAIAFALDVPLIGTHHIHGHICANLIAHESLEPPFLCLVASGGHSHLIDVSGYGEYRLLGATRDDAAGEAFDKVARLLGLPYPGGPHLEALALEGDAHAFSLPRADLAPSLDFSFSGLKTAVINLLHRLEQGGADIPAADVAASFQRTAVESLVSGALRALEAAGSEKLALCGGVAANGALRAALDQACASAGASFFCPPLELCTDNAQMIACAGYYELLGGRISDLDLNAQPARPLF